MADETPQLKSVKAPHGAHVFEVAWLDGRRFQLPHRILRGYCPCASCQGHGGSVSFVDAGDPEILEIRQVGNYALELGFSDSHATGIYTYPFLRKLGALYDEHGDALPSRFPTLPDG